MKKTMKKILAVALVIMMTLPFAAFSVNADTTEAEPAELTPAEVYAAAENGDLLQTVNFKADYWSQEFASSSNCGAEVAISEDGSLAKLTVLNTSSKRAMWGGIDSASKFPLREVTEVKEIVTENPDDPENPTITYENVYGKSNTYTIVYDVDFGNTTAGKTVVGLQIDGDNALCVDGYGFSYWYAWNTKAVDKPNETTESGYKWNYHITQDKSEKQTFAVEIDPAKNEMTLYIKDIDGSFGKVRTMTYDGAKIGNNLNATVTIRGTVADNSWAEVSDIQIYKGLISEIKVDRAAEYENAEVGDLLNTVDFSNKLAWNNGFVNKDNNGANVVVSADGSAAKLTVLSTGNKRAMWGGLDTPYTLRDVVEVKEIEIENPDDPENPTIKYENVYGKGYTYTLVFDADFGNTAEGKTLVGIQVGGDNAVCVDGYGHTYLYQWNTVVAGKETGNGQWNWHIDGDKLPKAEKQTFAVEVDPENSTMTLYIRDYDGTFNEVRSFECTTLDEDLNCRIYVKGTVADDSWVELSNVEIYKGLLYSAEEDDNTGDDNTDNGNTDNDNTDNGNTDNDNTDNGNTDNGNTDNGNTDNGNTDNGNTDNGNTDNGNTDNGNTNNGNTDNGNTNNGNTDNENTDNGNNDNENNGNENAENTNTENDAPTTDAPKAEEETEVQKSGCGASLAMSGVALVGTCAAMLAIKRRKDEEN